VNDDGIKATTGKWEEFFTARPGCLRPKDRGWRFLGLGAGGRVVQYDDHTLMVSVGDHQYDGFDDSWQSAQDPATDLGKIVLVDIATKKARVFATGVRNPQGLAILRDGRIIESEHGPQGGDEINLIRDGANYGWRSPPTASTTVTRAAIGRSPSRRPITRDSTNPSTPFRPRSGPAISSRPIRRNFHSGRAT
jgi:glucose/arabinose dehydrogenase